MSIQINGFQHLGIPVTNLEQSIEFYAKLGFANVMESTFKLHGEIGKVSMMKRGNMIIEIYQMPEPELTEVKKRKNGHVDHMAFDVDDIDLTYAWMKENGFQIDEPEPVFLAFWDKGCKYFHVIGPDGERLEFNQILK